MCTQMHAYKPIPLSTKHTIHISLEIRNNPVIIIIIMMMMSIIIIIMMMMVVLTLPWTHQVSYHNLKISRASLKTQVHQLIHEHWV